VDLLLLDEANEFSGGPGMGEMSPNMWRDEFLSRAKHERPLELMPTECVQFNSVATSTKQPITV